MPKFGNSHGNVSEMKDLLYHLFDNYFIISRTTNNLPITTTKIVNVPSCSQIFLVILRLNEQGVVEVVEERDVIGRGRWHGFN